MTRHQHYICTLEQNSLQKKFFSQFDEQNPMIIDRKNYLKKNQNELPLDTFLRKQQKLKQKQEASEDLFKSKSLKTEQTIDEEQQTAQRRYETEPDHGQLVVDVDTLR